MSDWLPIEKAPKDESVIIATTGDWVGEAILEYHPHNENWRWVWAGSFQPIAPELKPLAWQYLPAHPNSVGSGGDNRP